MTRQRTGIVLMLIGAAASVGGFGYEIVSEHWWDGSTKHIIASTLLLTGYVLMGIGLTSNRRRRRQRASASHR